MEEFDIGFKEYSDIATERIRKHIDNFEYRFNYNMDSHKIELPKAMRRTYTEKERFQWIITSINHEFLHHILNTLVNRESCDKLDALPYSDVACGNVE